MSDRSEREIRERIESTRARMGDTIEQIGDRVNPDRVKAEIRAKAREQIHEAKDNVKRKARDTMRNVEHGVTDAGRGIWATIRENPLPAGMVGFGLAWMIANRRGGDEPRERDYETYSTGPAVTYRAGHADRNRSTAAPGATGRIEHGYEGRTAGATGATASGAELTGEGANADSQGIREKAAEVVDQATDRISDAQEAVGDWAHDQQERVGSWAHEKKDRIGELAQETRYRARSAERRVEDSMRENPLAAGAVVLAMGVAAGLIVPESQREHELMGRSRDRVLDKAEDAARRAAEKVHDTVRDKAGETARHAVDEVWPGGDSRGELAEGYSEPRR
jgi:ElaB/YqjD/DUF883 family membrane-anchored ribosome-binding protein